MGEGSGFGYANHAYAGKEKDRCRRPKLSHCRHCSLGPQVPIAWFLEIPAITQTRPYSPLLLLGKIRLVSDDFPPLTDAGKGWKLQMSLKHRAPNSLRIFEGYCFA
jgi:hypothetical protein